MEIKNLFKNPRTNWKYIVIVLILAVVVGGGILIYSRDIIKEIVFLSEFSEIEKPEEVKGEFFKYFFSGVFINEAKQEEINDLDKRLEKFNVNILVFEGLPQFIIIGFDKKDCSGIKDILSTLEYIKSFDECQEKPILLKPEETNNEILQDWKIYKNEEARYEIKYPKNLEIIATEENQKMRFPHHLYITSEDFPGVYEVITNLEEDVGYNYIEEWKEFWKQEGISFSSVEIDKKQGLKTIPYEKNQIKQIMIILENYDKIYKIRFALSQKNVFEVDKIFNSGLKDFDQMLSTFKFLK